ncbi:restriction endonuclease subunit S [Phascolarctobacterium succinatutens]|uniref:restriction endonuclease subunit S n=1 Tax=Phascolarctobacterium succinatutens TaxID=626940 RepID=UPI0023F8BE21|nr:restriction endonuclease subunit S [Phascolarctobacterium succinatutens]
MFAYKGELAMPKKKTALTIEERLQQALVPAEEQPYEVPENWVWVRLGEVNKYVSKSVNPISEPDKIFELYSVPSMADDYPEIIAGSDIGSSKQSVCKEDVLLCKINPRINRVWKVSQFTDNELIASSEWIIIRNNHINANYLMYCFQSKYFREFMLSNVSGVGGSLMRAQPKYVQTYPIPLPPLSEQQRIVESIEELFAKLDEAKERLQEVADSFAVRKAAILHNAFTGELTKQWRRENGVSYESWEEKKGEDFFEYVTSGSRGWAKYYSDKGSIFIRMGNLNHGTIELDFSDIQYVELPDQVEGQRSKLQKNDILISITADVGMIALVREDMDAYINQHVALARPKNDLYAEFLAWYFVSDDGLQQMQNKQRGATKIGLGLQDIRSIILKIPILPEQHEIVRLIDDLLARERAAQQAAEQALASIDLMKKSILARAFRGELGTNKASEASALELLKQVLAEN